MVVQKNRFGTAWASLLFSQVLAFSAWPAGQASLESNGFLKRSTDRPDSTQTISVGPKVSSQGRWIDSRLDVRGIVQVSDGSTFTVEGPDAYIATSDQISKKYKTSLGRKSRSWSTFDDYWEFGTFSPRFVWDPTRPQKIGMTGVFQEYTGKHVSWTAFASPLSIPERGFPTREENGHITSSNPFYTPLYEYIELRGRIFPIKYDIQYPAMSELLVNPNAALSFRYENSPNRGFWAQLTGAYLPIHQVTLNVETFGAFDPIAEELDLYVYPTVLMHKMVNLETGVKAKRFSLWGSLAAEFPEENRIPSSYISPVIQNSIISSIGASAQISKILMLESSYLYIHEEAAPAKEDGADVEVDLQSRFPFHQALRTHLNIDTGRRWSYRLGWIRDFQNASDQWSGDMTYLLNTRSQRITLNAGVDFFSSSTGKGYIGQYRGNDRVRGAISYAF